jgi:hypothetical protein
MRRGDSTVLITIVLGVNTRLPSIISDVFDKNDAD